MKRNALKKMFLAGSSLLIFSLSLAAPPALENPLRPDWKRYHSNREIKLLLEGWAQFFSRLVRVYSIGKTLKGTSLQVIEITNNATGPASEKPAYYYDGNVHSEELIGAEVALHFAWRLLTGFGKDARVTALLDTRAVYIRPKFNPDGADIALSSVHNPRSTPRPYDDDSDGLLDEDPPNDLDGDGVVTQMRRPNPNGAWTVSKVDPRLNQRRSPGHSGGGYFDLLSEGYDDDDDGSFNEDDVGGIDLNRNFPRNWGMEFEQPGAGPYPLSEPESAATIEFLRNHRNVTGIFHGHSSGGFLYRLPSTTGWDNFDASDQQLILELAQRYEQSTGQRVAPSYSDARSHRHGTLISWAYWDYGVVGFVPEFWAGIGEDQDGDGRVSELERLKWNDSNLKGLGFARWKKFNHPQLGQVEIGGWRRRFTIRNPPVAQLKAELEKYVDWMLYLAELTPRVQILNTSVAALEVSDLKKVLFEVANVGYLPTFLTRRALANGSAQPVRVVVEPRDCQLFIGTRRTAIGHLAGLRQSDDDFPRSRRLEYLVKVTGQFPTLSITAISEKGGTARLQLALH